MRFDRKLRIPGVTRMQRRESGYFRTRARPTHLTNRATLSRISVSAAAGRVRSSAQPSVRRRSPPGYAGDVPVTAPHPVTRGC